MSKTTYLKEKEATIRESYRKIWDIIATPDIDPSKKSYMGTVPYPYANGELHMGHLFTYLHMEFDTQHQRMKGKKVLFPFAYHGTGVPIVAAANKVKFELENPNQSTQSSESSKKENTESTVYRSSKSKLVSKQGTSQITTLLSMGIPEADIPKFVEPMHWLEHFIPNFHTSLENLGFGIDWTRQFTTVDNPYYSSFVDWQFNHLYQSNKLKYGKRYTIFSAKDNQPCQDHDRSSGEGVQCQEYTLVPFLLENTKNAKRPFKLLAATMRPETMFGLTNLWIHPDLEYGVYEHDYKDLKDVVIMCPRSAENMKFQEHQLTLINTIKGSEMIGLEVTQEQQNPDRKLYVLPMYQISANKGTGIVSSVPSESPDDYLNLLTLTIPNHPNRKKMLENFPETSSLPIDPTPIPIIETTHNDKPTTQIAVDFCTQNNIKNPNALNGQKLQEAKRTIYNQSRKGKFLYNNKSVEETTKELKSSYESNYTWMPYAEPESEVISRSNDVCVVALDNQWYIDYGEPEWKQQVKDHIQDMEFYSEKGKHQFEHAVEWLSQWPCSRTMGLGTTLKVPCPNPDDKNTYLIDSLSDSTIYMSLYTIYPILQTIPQKYVTSELFNVVFLEKPIPDSLKPIENLIKQMQESFQYWYPMDIRVSGKDLIQNHFIMCLYNHIAIFPKKCWPKSFRTNGHITINQVKMSKSKGNFITAKQLFNNYGVDATRLALAYGSPDPIVDSNFEGKKKTEDGLPSLDMVNSSFSKLYEMYHWTDEVFQNFSSYRTTPLNFFDQLFIEQITVNTIEAVKQMDNHVHSEAVVQSFNHMLTNRNTYLQYTKNDPHQEVIKYFLESFSRYNTPFIPYMCEYIHYNMNTKLLSNPTPGSVKQLQYPSLYETRYPDTLHKFMFIDNITTTINRQLKTWFKKNPKQHPKNIMIVMGSKMEDWQLHTMSIVDKMLETTSPDMVLKTSAPVLNKDEKLQEYISTLKLNFKKKVQPFVSIYVKFNDMFKFDRTKTLQELQPFLKNYFQTDVAITQDEAVDPLKPVINVE